MSIGTIRITDFHASRPLQGLLSMSPHMDLLKAALDETLARVERMWGKDRPIHVCAPLPGDLDGFAMAAWLQGPERDPEDHGTHLIVVWFAKQISEDPLRSALARVDKVSSWDALSKGFQY